MLLSLRLKHVVESQSESKAAALSMSRGHRVMCGVSNSWNVALP